MGSTDLTIIVNSPLKRQAPLATLPVHVTIFKRATGAMQIAHFERL